MRRRRLLVVALAGVLVAVPGLATPAFASTCSPGLDWPAARAAGPDDVVAQVNAHRRARGLTELSVSPTLTLSAAWKARHMARYGYLAHDDPAPPEAQHPDERLAACGYSLAGGWGENIAAGQRTAQDVMTAWLQSPGHRANIERASFRAIGVGLAVSAAGTPYWAQEFGGVDDAGASPPVPVPAPLPAPVPAPGPAPAPQASGPTPLPLPAAVGGPSPDPGGTPLAGLPPTGAGRSVARIRARISGRTVVVRVSRRATVRVLVRPALAHRCQAPRCLRATWRMAAGTHRRKLPGAARLRPGHYVVALTATPLGMHSHVLRLRLALAVPRRGAAVP